MDFEAVKAILKANEKGTEALAALDAHIAATVETERTAASKEANGEAQKVREKFKKKWKELGLDPDASDFDAKLEDKKKALAAGAGKDTELSKVLAEIEELKEKVNTESEARLQAEKKATEAQSARNTEMARGSLLKKLGDKLHEADELADGLIARGVVKVKDDNKTLVWLKDGKELDFDKGADEYIKAKTGLAKNPQSPGGGSGGESGGKAKGADDSEKVSAKDKIKLGLAKKAA